MAEVKKISESPTIADIVQFDILTPGADGCFTSNPYRVDSISIYFLEKDFTNRGSSNIHSESIPEPTIEALLSDARILACNNPSEENLQRVSFLENQLQITSTKSISYFSQAIVVSQFGTVLKLEDGTTITVPAWSPIDSQDYALELVPTDPEGNTQYGHFSLQWNPLGMRAGDYLIYWTWSPNITGDKITSHQSFSLLGSTQITTSIPTHQTKPEKYETLMKRYMPDMFNMKFSNDDISPQVLQELNGAIADGFTFIEDMANQIIDLLDANATSESLLKLLGNTFGLQLRSNDPTMWRRQIKRAVPLFKKKGTFSGLSEALAQAGISLKKFTRLWQVVSKYTYQEVFTFISDTSFVLDKLMVLPVDTNNFELYFRAATSDTWTQLDETYVSFSNADSITTMTWIGTALTAGDEIRVVYEFENVPVAEQTIETYIRSLPLGDLRDERNQLYPPKNWNVRVIEESDPYFDTIINPRNPYYNPLVYGKIRTEFPYSENIYNMEEYNGSKRDSYNPCDIDKEFIDNCSNGPSSLYTLDVEIEEIGSDKIEEAQEIIKEFTPFHAVLHSLNLLGSINEFVPPQQEQIKIMVSRDQNDITLVDPVQMIFNRTMDTETANTILRTTLASEVSMITTSGAAANNEMVCYAPNVRFDNIGVQTNPDLTLLEILSPSASAGNYQIETSDGLTKFYSNFAKIVSPPSEPISSASFTFRLSNELLSQSNATITQDNVYYFTDLSTDFLSLGADSTFKFNISGTDYDIVEMMPNGSFILQDDGSLSGLVGTQPYSLKNSLSVVIATGVGMLSVKLRGIVDFTGAITNVMGNSIATINIPDFRNLMNIGDYLLVSGSQYIVSGFVPSESHQFYIEDYIGGTASGLAVAVYNRLIDNAVGLLKYRGLSLTTSTNYEVDLGILDGSNPPLPVDAIPETGPFMSNFLVKIDGYDYSIRSIDGTVMQLEGPMRDWTLAGTPKTVYIYQFEKNPFDIPQRTDPDWPGYIFSRGVDRRGQEIFEIQTENATPLAMLGVAQNAVKNNQMIETTGQKESIVFTIEQKGKP